MKNNAMESTMENAYKMYWRYTKQKHFCRCDEPSSRGSYQKSTNVFVLTNVNGVLAVVNVAKGTVNGEEVNYASN